MICCASKSTFRLLKDFFFNFYNGMARPCKKKTEKGFIRKRRRLPSKKEIVECLEK